ncbi:MAG TPA: aminoglycoside phosphotransferase family protein [Propionibacteriaceae bacterium]|nr:aminoglycoside phosphotransferase family protein [Propionibacteriaceae bacterium]
MLGTGSASAIAAEYDLGPVIDFTGPVARGEQGEVWRLNSTSGSWAVKTTFAPLSAAEAEVPGEFQARAEAEGVPAPTGRRSRDGHWLADVDDTAIRVFRWMEMEPPDPQLDPVLVGRTVAALHRVELPTRERPDEWYTEPIGAAAWAEIAAEAKRQRAPFADRLAAVCADLIDVESMMHPMTAVQNGHRDLWADNVRGTPDGGILVIDWDNAGPADPSRELALVLFEFGRGRPDRLRLLYEAYLAHGGPGRIEFEADFSMVIAQLHHIGAMQLRRWLNPGLAVNDRARATASIAEFLDTPLNRPGVEEILAVTRSLNF